MGSVAGLLIGGGKGAVYAAAKRAQINFGYVLDRELRAEGIRTTVIAPAGVNTPFAAGDGRFGDLAPEDGPFMDTGDIAGAIIYTLTQPRRMRTELWTMWSLAEQHCGTGRLHVRMMTTVAAAASTESYRPCCRRPRWGGR